MINSKQKKLPLTIVILTHINDLRFLNALKSSQIAQEVIIIDNNSKNNWKKLGQKFNFELVSHENKILNFAKVRNESLTKVKTDWVLFLDSDESLGNSPEELKHSKKSIQQVIDDDLFDGVTITRKDLFLGKTLKYGEVGNVKLTRMFKVKKGKFTRSVHEVAKISGKLGRSEIIISHFSHLSISDFLHTITKYAKMASKNERSSKTSNLFKMIFYPSLKFIQNYFLKLGLLDGYRGLIYAITMSLHSLFVRVFYFEKYFKKINNEHQT